MYISFKIYNMSAISPHQNDRFDDALDTWSRLRPDLEPYAMCFMDRFIEISNVITKSDVYDSDMNVLTALFRSGVPYQLSPTQLMHAVDLTSGAMTALLNRLEKKELIFRKNDTLDGRISMAVLTPKGISVIDKLVLLRSENASSIMAIFDDFEKRQLSQLLKKMLRFVNAQK